MSHKNAFRAVALAAALIASAGAGHAATVYCPNGTTGALVAPTSGRYVEVTNAANPGTCYYQQGNLQNATITSLGYTLVDENGLSGSSPGALTGSLASNSTSGTWIIDSSRWSGGNDLYIGFHFGNGGGNPDSFIVQLESGQTSGNWAFLAVAPDSLNGLSNYYLLSTPAGSPPQNHIPEPGSLALAGLALVAAVSSRRLLGRKS